jgi:hypothetical protein
MQKPKRQKIFIVAVIILTVLSFTTTAFAVDVQQGMDPIQAMNNLVDFILSIVTVIGVIALIWGAVQLSLALKSQDASQRTSAILFLAGGAIMVGVKFVLQAIGVTV